MIGISSSIPKTNYVLMIVELVDELMKSIYQSCNLFLELIVTQEIINVMILSNSSDKHELQT